VSAAGSLRQTLTQSFHDIHVRGVRNLVEACRAQRVRRVVHLSALGAHVSSRSALLRAKFLGEDLLRRSLLDVTVLRPSAAYGAGDDFISPIGRFLARWPIAPLPGGGRDRLRPIAAVDIAAAAMRALDRPDTIGQLYDLGGPESLSITAIYDRVMAALGVRRPKVRVPYVVIEPLALVLRTSPVLRFSFDQLAILEEEASHALANPGPAALGLSPAPLDDDTIRAIVTGLTELRTEH
jgi:NADH dehydrogenase